VGVGVDPDVARAAELEQWLDAADDRAKFEAMLESWGLELGDIDGQWQELTPTQRAVVRSEQDKLASVRAERAEIAAEIIAEGEAGRRIMALAGGRDWGNGRAVVCGGMARKAADYICNGNGRVMRNGKRFNGRGVKPSATSVEEAASVATGAMWEEWQVLTSLWPVEWNRATTFHLARVGWRAAFRSFGHDLRQGMTGRKADHPESVQLAPLEGASLAVERASLDAWAADRQGRIFDPGQDELAIERRERRAVIGWIASVLDVHAKGRTGAAERARFSLLARLVHGRDIATAARGAGFASGRSAIQSFIDGRVWARLGAAIGARATGRGQRGASNG
jgi:hypothetical protein